MDVEKWQKGVNVCIDNILRLNKDGKLLMENGSYGHACFSFITAFEEMGVAYFIMANYDTPKPKKLKGFLTHNKKIAVANLVTLFSTGEPFGNMRKLFDAFIKDKEKEFRFNKKDKSEIREFTKDIQEQESQWYFRNRGIYVSINNSNTDFLSPANISEIHAQKLKSKLEEILPHLQSERDLVMKYGSSSKLELYALTKMMEARVIMEDLREIFKEGSVEKINKAKNITPEFKDLLISLFLDNFPIKHKELEIEISPEMNEDDKVKMMIIFIYEFFKSFWEQFKSLLKSGRSKEVMDYYIERMRHYSSKYGNLFELFNPFLDIISKEDSNPKDLIKLFKQ